MTVLLILASLAAAYGPGTLNWDGWPPKRFMGDQRAEVVFTSQKGINKTCDDNVPNAPGLQTLGCSFDSPRRIYVLNPCSYPRSDEYAQLICHEIGHLNGWPSTHTP